jgi:hypothetical protein
MVNYDSGRGVRVQTRGEGEGARTTSRLTLPSASKGDEGNYTCSPSNTDPATVHVFIQEGTSGYSKHAALTVIHARYFTLKKLLSLFNVAMQKILNTMNIVCNCIVHTLCELNCLKFKNT